MSEIKLSLIASTISISLAIIAATLLFNGPNSPTALAGQGGISANSCAIVATTTVIVGDDSSQEVLASDARRAWAVIEQQKSATNTVSLAFGISATAASGYALTPGQASTTPAILTVGLNTDFPYTGAVNAITNLGSTTVRVIDCRY